MASAAAAAPPQREPGHTQAPPLTQHIAARDYPLQMHKPLLSTRRRCRQWHQRRRTATQRPVAHEQRPGVVTQAPTRACTVEPLHTLACIDMQEASNLRSYSAHVQRRTARSAGRGPARSPTPAPTYTPPPPEHIISRRHPPSTLKWPSALRRLSAGCHSPPPPGSLALCRIVMRRAPPLRTALVRIRILVQRPSSVPCTRI